MSENETRLFTPLHQDGNRIRMQLSKLDYAKVDSFTRLRSANWSVNITDQLTGQKYRVRGAPCGLGCYCDARVQLAIHDGSKPVAP